MSFISSVCSVGETSTLADEVNEVMGKMDPNDLQDIASDDEEDNQPNDIHTTDGMYRFDPYKKSVWSNKTTISVIIGSCQCCTLNIEISDCNECGFFGHILDL